MMDKLRECTLCTFSTYKQSTFSMHMLMKHPKKKPHQCTLCTQSFAVKTQLQHHMINKHTKTSINCQHPGCKHKFKNYTAEMVHYMKRHINSEEYFDIEEKGIARCLHCDSTFNKAAIYYHVGKCNPESPFHPNNAFFETFCPEFLRECDINLCADPITKADEPSTPIDDDISIYSDNDDILQNIINMDKSMDSGMTEIPLNHQFKENIPISASETYGILQDIINMDNSMDSEVTEIPLNYQFKENIPISASEANAYNAIMEEDKDGEALRSLCWFG